MRVLGAVLLLFLGCSDDGAGRLPSGADSGFVDMPSDSPDGGTPDDDAGLDFGSDDAGPTEDGGLPMPDAGTELSLDVLEDRGNFEIELTGVDIQEDLRPLAESVIGKRIQLGFVRAPEDGTRPVLFAASEERLPQSASGGPRWDAFAFEGDEWVPYPCELLALFDSLSVASRDPNFGVVIRSLRFADRNPQDGLDLRSPAVEMDAEWWIRADPATDRDGSAIAPMTVRGRVRLDEVGPTRPIPGVERGPEGTAPFVLPFEAFLIETDGFLDTDPSEILVSDENGSVAIDPQLTSENFVAGCSFFEDGELSFEGRSTRLSETWVPSRWYQGDEVSVTTVEPTRDLFGRPEPVPLQQSFPNFTPPAPAPEVDLRAKKGVRLIGTEVDPVQPCGDDACIGLRAVQDRWVGAVVAVEAEQPFRAVALQLRIDSDDCSERTFFDWLARGSTGPDSGLELFGNGTIDLLPASEGCNSRFRNVFVSGLGESEFRRATVAYEFRGRNLTSTATVTLVSVNTVD